MDSALMHSGYWNSKFVPSELSVRSTIYKKAHINEAITGHHSNYQQEEVHIL